MYFNLRDLIFARLIDQTIHTCQESWIGKSITALSLASKLVYLLTDLVAVQAIQGLPLLGFRCVPIPAFQFALLRERKLKKGIKYRKEKGKKSIIQRTLQRRGEDISYVTTLRSTLFLPSSTLACSSPFPICPC